MKSFNVDKSQRQKEMKKPNFIAWRMEKEERNKTEKQKPPQSNGPIETNKKHQQYI